MNELGWSKVTGHPIGNYSHFSTKLIYSMYSWARLAAITYGFRINTPLYYLENQICIVILILKHDFPEFLLGGIPTPQLYKRVGG